jgi:hypothetical protein
MLDESAKAKGYALMCVSEPLTDCRIRIIEEVTTLSSIRELSISVQAAAGEAGYCMQLCHNACNIELDLVCCAG